MIKFSALAVLAVFLVQANAVSIYGQCGGIGHTTLCATLDLIAGIATTGTPNARRVLNRVKGDQCSRILTSNGPCRVWPYHCAAAAAAAPHHQRTEHHPCAYYEHTIYHHHYSPSYWHRVTGSHRKALTFKLSLKASRPADAPMTVGKLYFGTAADAGTLNIVANANIIKGEFGQLTPENSIKWDQTELNQGAFTLSGGNTLVNFA
ncbi:glycoside hydrolase family 10 protein [Botryobasidium botryosum FD-172 SS1]|uniref:Glycoside hydrolase family 10 protein n=1 Tax=Botryobasidium botryosum (strain FD-172 SS1) TaxID=930990 RepID=A0A067MIF9_BOTB1|nr:glycoside hydrolase family 10 protein [Botryobasidium botryosum FD-172 SS1]